jgi:hypothetical protein
MDDSHIRELTEEVLSQLREGGAPATADLEARVAALESAVARLQRGGERPAPPADTAVHVHTHPALHVLSVAGGAERCVLEPEKPCVSSHACRVLGH